MQDQKQGDRPHGHIVDELLFLLLMGVGAFIALLLDFFMATGMPFTGVGGV